MYDFYSNFITNGVTFPDTRGKNVTNPGDIDGTEFIDKWIDDPWGFFQTLLNEAGLTPNNTPELASGTSQLYNALKILFVLKTGGTFTGDVTITGDLSCDIIEGYSDPNNYIFFNDLFNRIQIFLDGNEKVRIGPTYLEIQNLQIETDGYIGPEGSANLLQLLSGILKINGGLRINDSNYIGNTTNQTLMRLLINKILVNGDLEADNLLTGLNIGLLTDPDLFELYDDEVNINGDVIIDGLLKVISNNILVDDSAYFGNTTVNQLMQLLTDRIRITEKLRVDGGYIFDYRDSVPAETEITIKSKIIDIGDWNMDTTTSVQINPNIPDNFKIRRISVLIRQDGSTNNLFDLYYAPSGVAQGWIISINNITNIYLQRLTGGFFDDIAKFSSTSYNRGYIYIEYET